jgi:hypothetical protein
MTRGGCAEQPAAASARHQANAQMRLVDGLSMIGILKARAARGFTEI